MVKVENTSDIIAVATRRGLALAMQDDKVEAKVEGDGKARTKVVLGDVGQR